MFEIIAINLVYERPKLWSPASFLGLAFGSPGGIALKMREDA